MENLKDFLIFVFSYILPISYPVYDPRIDIECRFVRKFPLPISNFKLLWNHNSRINFFCSKEFFFSIFVAFIYRFVFIVSIGKALFVSE